MKSRERLQTDYKCSKCRGTKCHVGQVSLSQGVFHLAGGRYLTRTCALCGYTEFFDQAVYESLEEPAEEPARKPETATDY